MLAAFAIATVVGHQSIRAVIDRWDSVWFLRAAATGWPSHLPMHNGHVASNTIAFFPLFPLAIRWIAGLTGASLLTAGIVVSMSTGLTATVAVWMLVRRYAGARAADRATLLVALCPGAFVFSLVYAEGMVITFVAAGLIALDRRRWLLAGVLGMAATATAPIALAFVVSCLWAAGRAARRDRNWRPLVAPVLAPMGFVAYQLWLWRHTGHAMAWRMTEQGGWHSSLSPVYPFRLVWSLIAHPLTNTLTTSVLVAGILVAAAGAVLALRDHQPPPILLYGFVTAALALITVPVGFRPRFLLDAFPLVLALGTRLRGRPFVVTATASGVLLVAVALYTTTAWSLFP